MSIQKKKRKLERGTLKAMLFVFFRPPPSFKEVTPSCRTNMRQLLLREQCLQREQKLGHSNKQQPQTTSRQQQPQTNASQHEMAMATIAITREVPPAASASSRPCPIEATGQQQWMTIDSQSREQESSHPTSSLRSRQPPLLLATPSTSNVVKANLFS